MYLLFSLLTSGNGARVSVCKTASNGPIASPHQNGSKIDTQFWLEEQSKYQKCGSSLFRSHSVHTDCLRNDLWSPH
jgi:hypothetical protein